MLTHFLNPFARVRLDKDEGGGGAGSGDEPSDKDPKPGDSPPEDATGDETKKNGGKGDKPKGLALTQEELAKLTPQAVLQLVQDEVTRIAASIREDEREKTQKRIADEHETQRLEEQKQFEELATKRQAKIDELQGQLDETTGQIKALTEERDSLKAVVDKVVEERRKGLPDHLIALLDKLSAVEQLEYIATNAEALARKGGRAIGSPTPGPGSAAPAGDDEKGESERTLLRLPRL